MLAALAAMLCLTCSRGPASLSGSLRRRLCDRIDEVDEGVADLAMRDAVERGQQLERAAVGQQLDGSRALAARRDCIGIKQGADRDIEYLGDLRKAPGPDPVGAVFVFLDLLERDAKPASEVALRHARDQSTRPDGLPEFNVRGIRPPISFLYHLDRTLGDMIRRVQL